MYRFKILDAHLQLMIWKNLSKESFELLDEAGKSIIDIKISPN